MISDSSLGASPDGFAGGARQVVGTAHAESALQHNLGLSWPVEALLTDVVIWMCESRLAVPAEWGGGIHSVSKLSRTDLDKRISTTLCEVFFQFSQFLCGFEILMLQRVNGSPEFEKPLLSIKQLFIHGANYFHRLGLVPNRQGSFAEIDGTVDGGDGAGDKREIHAGSPNVEKGGVGVSDSTARGNGAGEGDHA